MSGLLFFVGLFWVPGFVFGGQAKGNGDLEVILDVDAGGDDAMAILMLLAKSNKHVHLKAVTCVNGNTGVDNVTINVLKTLHIAGESDIPVYKGSDQGLVQPIPFDYYFGYDGFGDFDFPHPLDWSLVKPQHAAEFLASSVKKNPGKITVIAIGPLTNIALATHLNPNFLKEVKELIFVGGSYQGSGNVKPGVEFNVYGDADAAAFVMSKSPVEKPITMIPMDTMGRAALPTTFRTEVLGKIDNKVMNFLNKVEAIELPKVGKLWYYWDPIAIIYLLDPSFALDSITQTVIVSNDYGPARGSTFVDFNSADPAVRIITLVDKEKGKKMLYDKLSEDPIGTCTSRNSADKSCRG